MCHPISSPMALHAAMEPCNSASPPMIAPSHTPTPPYVCSAKSGRRRLGQKDAVTMGNAWLGHAVREGLVQPIPDARRSRWWQTAGPRWQALVTRDKQGRLDPQVRQGDGEKGGGSRHR